MSKAKQCAMFCIWSFVFISNTIWVLYMKADKNEQKTTALASPAASVHPLADMELKDVPAYISSFVVSQSVEALAQLMNGLPIERTIAVLNTVFVDGQYQMSNRDKLELLFALVGNYKTFQEQEKLLDLLLSHPSLQQGAPLLTAIRSGYTNVIPLLFEWLAQKKKQGADLPDHINDLIIQSYTATVTNDKPDIFKKLQKNKVPLDALLATYLLWKVVTENKDAKFIPLLKNAGANINAEQNGYTPLIKAVLNNNETMVRALVQAGADINAVIDDEIGSALQTAISKGYTKIEIFLRSANGYETFETQNNVLNKQ